MKADITRDVISDLWPLYKAGEASADSRRMIEAFLAEDGAYRTLLDESETISRGLPDGVGLSPDAELRLIALARERIRTTAWLVGAAIGAFVFVSLAFVGGALLFAFRNS
jgi:hypothetical protein